MKAVKLALLLVLLAACGRAAPPAPTPTPTPSASEAHLKYAVMAVGGRPAWCGPPLVRVDEEQQAADQNFPQIKADAATYSEILVHVKPAGSEADPGYRMAVYQEWEVLQHLPLQPSGGGFAFDYQTSNERVAGTVDAFSRVQIKRRVAHLLGPCPICLPGATLIATPAGDVPAAVLRVGDPVWTRSADGRRLPARVVRTGSVSFDSPHDAVRLRLADGRSLTASPGHPTADGRSLGELRPGDLLDGSSVSSVEVIEVEGDTFDLLPSGPSGAYWADGILVGSTLQN